jgi:hypothetical protein
MLYNILPLRTLDLNQEFLFNDQPTIYVFKGIETITRINGTSLERALFSKKGKNFTYTTGLKDIEFKNGKTNIVEKLIKVMK